MSSLVYLALSGVLAGLAPVESPGAASADWKALSVVDYGAQPDGKTPATAAIQAAIDACGAQGGGTVRFPAGTYVSGALRMKSSVTLFLDQGATLLGSRNRDDYYGPPTDGLGRVLEGAPVFRNLIHGENLHDVAIRGPGAIDGSGSAFRDKSKRRTKTIYFEGCKNVLVEDVRLKNAGSWMQHYRRCENLTIRNIDVFNHVSFNNDGLNVDSCRNVTISGCRIDSDDDGLVLKSLSDEPCRNVEISDCTVSSHCNALKMGTESRGGFIDVSITDCTVFSPQRSEVIYGRQRGLAGIALEIVDGGRMENVRVSGVRIDGVSVPIFLRLGNRARSYGGEAKPGVGTLRNVRLTDITAEHTSEIGCSITGLPGHPIEDMTLENIRLGFDGGGTREDAGREISERETSYPESTMFGTLPAYGFYCRHAKGLKFSNVQLRTDAADLRHAMMFDDVQEVEIDGFDAQFSPGAAAMFRMVDVRRATLRGCSPQSNVDTLIALEGAATRDIVLEKSRLEKVGQAAVLAPEVPQGAFVGRDNSGGD
jgi:polygalacturonase